MAVHSAAAPEHYLTTLEREVRMVMAQLSTAVAESHQHHHHQHGDAAANAHADAGAAPSEYHFRPMEKHMRYVMSVCSDLICHYGGTVSEWWCVCMCVCVCGLYISVMMW